MKKGEFVFMEYVAKVGDEVFDLTDEALAKELGIWKKDAKYGPVGVIVGEGMAISGVDEAFEKMEVGQEKHFEIPPEKAFGFRNPGLVKTFPISDFISAFKTRPEPGMLLETDAGYARVLTSSSGRVRVDFNNPLVGKTLKYRLKIIRKAESDEEKLKVIMDYFGLEYELKDGKVFMKGENPEKAMELVKKYLGMECELKK